MLKKIYSKLTVEVHGTDNTTMIFIKKAHTPWKRQQNCLMFASKEGLVCFSSPFDYTAVDFLENLNCPIYKIASFEITDISAN